MPSNKVYSYSAKQYWITWITALVWNGITGFAIVKGGHNILNAFEENPIFYFFVLFPFIGLWIIIDAIRQTLAWHKFGKIPVILTPFPGLVGGSCAGHITLPIATGNAKQAEVSLNCIRHSVSNSTHNNHRQHYSKVIWQDQLSLKPEKYGRKTRLQFAFTPPYKLPETEPKSDDYHVWNIHIHIPLPGIDFDRSYEVPMEKADEASYASEKITKVQSSPIIKHQDTKIGSVPQINKTRAGTQFYYGHGRSKGMAIALMTFGVFTGVFAFFFFDGFIDFLPTTTRLMMAFVGLISLSLFFLGLFLVVNSLTVEVGLKGMSKQQRIFAYLLEEKFNASDIVDIITEQNASSTSGNTTRVWFCLKLLTADGQKIEVGDSLEGQSYADEIKQQMITALGATWQPATLKNTTEKVKKPLPVWVRRVGRVGKLSSYSFLIAFFYDMHKMFPELTEFISKLLP